MPPKSAPMTQATIRRMIKQSVDAAIAAERARQANVRNDASGSGPVRSRDTAPVVRECTFVRFMKCNPAAFCEVEGAVELRRWFEKSKSVFEISECAEVATMGLETVNQMPWTKMKQLMTVEFCPIEDIQCMEHELWNLKIKEYDIVAYTQRFNELALMCPRMGEVTSSKPTNLNEAEHMAHKLMEQKSQARNERILEGKKRKWENLQGGNSSVYDQVPQVWKVGHKASQGHTRNRCPKKVKQEEVREVRGRAYAIKDAEPKGPNVVWPVSMSSKVAICFCGHRKETLRRKKVFAEEKTKLGRCGAVAGVRGYSRYMEPETDFDPNLALFEIDLMSIELGTFDVIIGMDWLVKHDAVIVCGEKVIYILYGNKTLIVEGDKGGSRLKIILCIKSRKYVEQGCHLFFAHVTKKKSKKKRMEDTHVIRDFPVVFPEELPGLPPPRRVEF
ncbi:putative reverse transcriptase domain-containing protein [Tanacetum coccineum]|uniref:Reverse transcriptase domain-containing protein n=1 Tax=Tanacetum coccineum TaxID=301880 RepID=A0ABQ5J4B5_9ASTR